MLFTQNSHRVLWLFPAGVQHADMRLRRKPHLPLEEAGEVQRIVIAAQGGDILDGGDALGHQGTGVLHAQGCDIGAQPHMEGPPEDCGEVLGVVAKLRGDPLHG